MLNSKQRAYLRSLAQDIESVTQVGKLGINDSLIDSLDKVLEKRELIKITVLDNSGLDKNEAGAKLAEKLNAEFVCSIGKKLVFYRKSSDEKNIHIEI